MMAKIGFILLLLVFGALMFAAGALAPAGFKHMLDSAAGQLASYLPASKAGAAAPQAQGASAKASASASASANSGGGAGAGPAAGASSASASTAAVDKSPPVPAASLLIPTPLPEKGQYALQAGQFANAADADALYATIGRAKLAGQKIPNVQDQDGKLWTVVALGPYASLDAARTASSVAATQLGLPGPLPVIVLPPAPAKS